MKNILITLIMILSYHASLAQDVEYFILTSQSTRTNEGIEKIQRPKKNVDNYGAIFFTLRSVNRDIELSFIHVNHDLNSIVKFRATVYDRIAERISIQKNLTNPTAQMEIKTVTQSFVNSVNPIDLDILFPTWTKEQAKAFYESMRRKKYIYN